jgi:hypothetical protein
MSAYQDVAGVINMSAAEFAKLNAALLSSADIQTNLLGLSQQERIAKTQEARWTAEAEAALPGPLDAPDEARAKAEKLVA